jgi:tight adherence protein C
MFIKLIAVATFWVMTATGLLVLWYRMRVADEVRERLYDQPVDGGRSARGSGVAEPGPLRRWLYLAGFRSQYAPAAFIVSTLIAVACGAASAMFVYLSGLRTAIAAGVEAIPGGVGQLFLPLAMLMPWLVGILLGMVPWLYVRSARRNRVQLVEQDLPLALELLATLSEAGLGFDAALSRIMSTRLSDRPLADEFQTFQADLLAGRPRVESLRRFSHRLNISTVSIFVSALAQAEQIGMGISGVLRRQADDMRSRRRERANALAAALPVKRMLPLVVCFLPGLFVWTLGPFFVQLFKIADTFIQVRNF